MKSINNTKYIYGYYLNQEIKNMYYCNNCKIKHYITYKYCKKINNNVIN